MDSDQHFLDSHIEDKRWLDDEWWAKPTLPGYPAQPTSAPGEADFLPIYWAITKGTNCCILCPGHLPDLTRL